MAFRLLLAAGLLWALTGCGGTSSPQEVRVLAPAWAVDGIPSFERRTGCHVDLRVYDEGEELAAIARRRNVDAIAAPVDPGPTADAVHEFVELTVEGGVRITIPEELASAFAGPRRRVGRRAIKWRMRSEGDNPGCALRWIAYARAQDTSVSRRARNGSGSGIAFSRSPQRRQSSS